MIYALSLMDYIDSKELEEQASRYQQKIWSIAGCMVGNTHTAPDPRLFVVRKELLSGPRHNTSFPSQIIYNPRITKAEKEHVFQKPERRTVWDDVTERREVRDVLTPYTVSNEVDVETGHVHFLRYKPRKVKRLYRIKVFYWYTKKLPLIGCVILPCWETVEGLKSFIFQQMIEDFDAQSHYAKKGQKAKRNR